MEWNLEQARAQQNGQRWPANQHVTPPTSAHKLTTCVTHSFNLQGSFSPLALAGVDVALPAGGRALALVLPELGLSLVTSEVVGNNALCGLVCGQQAKPGEEHGRNNYVQKREKRAACSMDICGTPVGCCDTVHKQAGATVKPLTEEGDDVALLVHLLLFSRSPLYRPLGLLGLGGRAHAVEPV